MAKASEIVPTKSTAEDASTPLAIPQRAAARLRFGERFAATAEVEVTPTGMLAIGGMVGAILLGSAAVVLAAKRRRS